MGFFIRWLFFFPLNQFSGEVLAPNLGNLLKKVVHLHRSTRPDIDMLCVRCTVVINLHHLGTSFHEADLQHLECYFIKLSHTRQL